MSQNPTLPRENAFYPSVPPISLELTSKCNLKCPYCSNGQLDRPLAFIQWELLERIVQQCVDGRHNIAALHGTGEPLLWKRLEDAIRLIRGSNAGTASFATNGTLLSAKRAKRLLDAGLSSIRVSLDSLDETIYAATRGGKVGKVIANIRRLIELAPADFRITIVLMRHKEQKIEGEQVAQFYRTFGFHENVELEIVDNGLMVSASQDFRETPVKVSRCSRPQDWFTITSEGKVSICCADQNALGVLGDVRSQTIDEIWFSTETQTTLANIALGRGICPGVCTEHCWLEDPRMGGGGTKAFDACYEQPFSEVVVRLESAVLEGDFARAGEILRILEERDPENRRMSYFREIVYGVGTAGGKATVGESLKTIERFSQEAAAKDDLIRRHHEFARRLQQELAERRIGVATRWDECV